MSGQRLVEVDDGLRLMTQQEGTGSPPVVCLSCAGGSHEEWSDVAGRLHPLTRVLTYGRPGLGGSDPLGADRAGQLQNITWAALQLRILLRAAAIEPPYVLLTSSVGSWIADQYAALRPDEVAGLVLIDPTPLSPWPKGVPPRLTVEDAAPGVGGMRLSRENSYAELHRSPPSTTLRSVVVSSSDGRWARDTAQSSWWGPLTLAQVDELWQGYQCEWVRRLAALQVVADTAGHFVHRDQPDLVAHVTAAVVDAARRGAPVDLDAAEVAARAGQLRP